MLTLVVMSNAQSATSRHKTRLPQKSTILYCVAGLAATVGIVMYLESRYRQQKMSAVRAAAEQRASDHRQKEIELKNEAEARVAFAKERDQIKINIRHRIQTEKFDLQLVINKLSADDLERLKKVTNSLIYRMANRFFSWFELVEAVKHREICVKELNEILEILRFQRVERARTSSMLYEEKQFVAILQSILDKNDYIENFLPDWFHHKDGALAFPFQIKREDQLKAEKEAAR